MSSTMKHYEATLNRNQSSLPNIEKPRLSSPIIDLDGIDKREEEIKNKEELNNKFNGKGETKIKKVTYDVNKMDLEEVQNFL